MARRLKEEKVTIALMRWLVSKGWEILCYDFPQSGTGKVIHPNGHSSKTDGVIIPDIIAIKANKAVYFENKNRFVLEDFHKINNIKTSGNYSEGLTALIGDRMLYYGIGIPSSKNILSIINDYSDLTDFIISTDGEECTIDFQSTNIF